MMRRSTSREALRRLRSEGCLPEARNLIRKYARALCDPWIIERLEHAPKPLTPDHILEVMIDALRWEGPLPQPDASLSNSSKRD